MKGKLSPVKRLTATTLTANAVPMAAIFAVKIVRVRTGSMPNTKRSRLSRRIECQARTLTNPAVAMLVAIRNSS